VSDETPGHALERIAELTGRLLRAEVALGEDAPIATDRLAEAIETLVAERDRLRDANRKIAKALIPQGLAPNPAMPEDLADSVVALVAEHDGLRRVAKTIAMTVQAAPDEDLVDAVRRVTGLKGAAEDALGRAYDTIQERDAHVVRLTVAQSRLRTLILQVHGFAEGLALRPGQGMEEAGRDLARVVKGEVERILSAEEGT
jgi:hypothetical protein